MGLELKAFSWVSWFLGSSTNPRLRSLSAILRMADSGKASVSLDVAKRGREIWGKKDFSEGKGVVEKRECDGEGFRRVLEGFMGWKLQKGSNIGVEKTICYLYIELEMIK